jgi:23S rRNA (cytosine1962-C5)-methyltransferase
MNSDRAVITPKGIERIQSGHLWIYRSDVVSCEAEPGTVVSVSDKTGKIVGKAFYSSTSLITLRLLVPRNEPVDRSFWKQRLDQARQLRQRVVHNTEAYRLVHGEGDGLPSIIVDCYKDVLVVQTLSQGAEKLKPLLVELLRELLSPRAILERNDSRVRELEGLAQQAGVLCGEDPGEMICEENGLKFYFNLLTGQKTGAFLDQRENRARLRELAFGRALDCFCYAGSFALNMAPFCDTVEAIDISEDAIAAARRNAQLNELNNIEFVTENVFDRLRLFQNLKKRFDTIVLDPPAFAKNRSQVTAALRGYKEINLRALRLLNPGGMLVSASCSQLIDESSLLNIITEAAADARRRVQIIQKCTQAQDHPILLSMPETYYLKCFFLRVLD